MWFFAQLVLLHGHRCRDPVRLAGLANECAQHRMIEADVIQGARLLVWMGAKPTGCCCVVGMRSRRAVAAVLCFVVLGR